MWITTARYSDALFVNCIVLMQHVSAQEEATKRPIRQKRNYCVSCVIILHQLRLRLRSKFNKYHERKLEAEAS